MTPPNNEIGQAFRDGFLELLAQMGTEFEAGGETRKALIQEVKEHGGFILKFSDEFGIKKGDKVRNCATEQMYSVSGVRPVSRGGSYNHFEVGVLPS